MRENFISRKNLNIIAACIITITVLFGFSTQGFCTNGFQNMTANSGYEDVFEPQLLATSILVDDDDEPPKEPNIVEIKFSKYPPLASLKERIDRLVHGINTYVMPKNDHYGHEIRRYMAHVGNVRIYEDEDYLLEQYRNAKKAKVIAEYWKKYLNKEVSEIEEIIEKGEGISFAERTAFRQNKQIVHTFMIVIKPWIEANEAVLQKIGERPEMYSSKYPEVLVAHSKYLTEFYNLLSVRAAKLKDIQAYSSFAMMVY